MITIGDTEVGKSCIIKRYCEKRFVSKYLMTIGIDYGVTKNVANSRVTKLNIFDMSGHVAFAEVRREFYTDANCILLVFDASNKDSFRNLDSWFDEAKREIGGESNLSKVQCILCANKIDKNRNVSEIDGKNWAAIHGFSYMECSAFDGTGVNDLFELIFSTTVEAFENGGKPLNKPTNSIGYTKEEIETVEKIISANDNFERLGLNSYKVTEDDVKKAYKKLAGIVHPDKCAAPRSEEAFKLLVQTKSTLLARLDAK